MLDPRLWPPQQFNHKIIISCQSYTRRAKALTLIIARELPNKLAQLIFKADCHFIWPSASPIKLCGTTSWNGSILHWIVKVLSLFGQTCSLLIIVPSCLLEGFPLLDSLYHTVLLPSCLSGQFSLTSPKTGIPQDVVLPLFFSPFAFLTPEKMRSIFWTSQAISINAPKVDLHLGPFLWNRVLFIQLPISYLHYMSLRHVKHKGSKYKLLIFFFNQLLFRFYLHQ